MQNNGTARPAEIAAAVEAAGGGAAALLLTAGLLWLGLARPDGNYVVDVLPASVESLSAGSPRGRRFSS